jgi:nucleoid DNA-binding protein
VKRKTDIDYLVAETMGVKQRTVSKISTLWIEALRSILVEDGAVYIDTLGTMHVQVRKAGPRVLVKGTWKKGVRRGRTLVAPQLETIVWFRKAGILSGQLKQRYVLPEGDNENVQRAEPEGRRGRGHEQARGRRKRQPGAA